jgi:hypothetical protein
MVPTAPGRVDNVYPHEISWICRVEGVAICNIVLMEVPVATADMAAVVGIAAFQHLYRCMCPP